MNKLGLVLLSGLMLTGCQSKEEKIEKLTDEAYDVVGEIFDVLDKTNSPSNEKKYNDLVSNLDNINKKCKKLDVDYCVENIFTDWDYTLALTLGSLSASSTSGSDKSTANYVEITKSTITEDKYGYGDVSITIKNISNQDIDYIRYDIFAKNSSGEIVDSDWSNWSGTLKVGASQTMETTIKNYDSTYTYSIEIDEVSFK